MHVEFLGLPWLGSSVCLMTFVALVCCRHQMQLRMRLKRRITLAWKLATQTWVAITQSQQTSVCLLMKYMRCLYRLHSLSPISLFCKFGQLLSYPALLLPKFPILGLFRYNEEDLYFCSDFSVCCLSLALWLSLVVWHCELQVLSDPEQRMVYDEINGYALTSRNPFLNSAQERDHVFVDEFTCIGQICY